MTGGGYKTALIVLSCLVISVLGQGDRPCPGQTTCTEAKQCAWFVEITNLSNTNKAEYKRRIPETKKSVCNKTLKKVCCPSPKKSSSTTPTPHPTQEDFSPSWIPSLAGNDCGDPYGAAFIVGGEDTENGEFPWTVLLGTNAPRSGSFEWYCGGSLINRWYVVTAAHCKRPTVVRVGEWRVVDDTKPDREHSLVFSTKQLRSCRKRNRPCRNFHLFDSGRDCVDGNGEFVYSARQEDVNCGPPHQDFNVASYTKHPQYKALRSGVSINDISLVKLEKPVRLISEGQSNVSPICLPIPGTIEGSPEDIGEPGSGFQNPKGVVVGWGKTQTQADRNITISINSAKQKKLTMPLLSNARCQDIYFEAGISRDVIDPSYHLCAGAEDDRDSCKGDSGGPLIYRKTSNSPYWLVGIVAFGSNTCGIGIPAVFTRTTSYIDWIRQNLM